MHDLYDWKVLNPRHMSHSKLDPNHNVVVYHRIIASCPSLDTLASLTFNDVSIFSMVNARWLTLICMIASTEQLMILIRRHKDVVVAKFCPSMNITLGMSYRWLHRRSLNLVGEWHLVDTVLPLRILHNEHSILPRIKIVAARFIYDLCLRHKAIAVRIVGFIPGHCMAFGVCELIAIIIAAYCWVNPERHDVLMMLRQYTIVHDRAPGSRESMVHC